MTAVSDRSGSAPRAVVDPPLGIAAGGQTWRAQVVHVVAKDLSRLRWILAIYVVALIADSVLLVHGLNTFVEDVNLWGALIWVYSALIVMLIVQDDSPIAEDAQWRTLPLRPSAVMTAKALTIVLVPFALPVVATYVVLRLHEETMSAGAGMLLSPAQGALTGVLVAALLAAVTRNARTFFAAFVVILLGSGMLAGAIAWLLGEGPAGVIPGPMPGAQPLSALLVAAAIGMLYRRQPARFGRGVAVAAIAMSLLANLPVWRFGAAHPLSDPPITDGRELGITEVRLEPGFATARNVPVVLSIDTALTGRFGLSGVRGRMEVGGRTTTANEQGKGWSTEWFGPAVGGERFFRDGRVKRFTRTATDINVTPSQADEIASGTSRLWIDGNGERWDGKWILDLPVHGDTIARWGNRRLRIGSTSIDSGNPGVVLLWTAIGSSVELLPLWRSSYAVRLVNDIRGETFEMYAHRAGSSTTLMPLSGMQVRVHRIELDSKPWPGRDAWREGDRPAIDAEWLRGARLRILEWQEPRQYRIRIPVLPPDSLRAR